jgi:transcriptional regulator with XRE-family HTH domain
LPRTSLEPVCDALAYVIQEHRTSRKLSTYAMAQRTRLSRQMIAMVEKRRRVPTVDTVARISRALGMPLTRLVSHAEARVGNGE